MMNWKCLLILFVIISFNSPKLLSQFDLKIDPAAALLGKNIKGGFEVALDDLFSIDADFNYSPSVSLPFTDINFNQARSTGYRLIGKFYPYPKFGMDAFYVGPYMKYRHNKSPIYTHTRIALGFMTGYKTLLPRKFYFEIGAGIGLRVHASIRNNAGDFIDGLTGVNFFGGIYDFFSSNIGKYDLTTRLAIGYRLSGNGPKTKKEQKAIIKP